MNICSLGANHDGQENNCDSTRQYIMSSTIGRTSEANVGNSWRFSDCSVTFFDAYFRTLDK